YRPHASYIGRRELLAALGGAAAAWPIGARAQQAHGLVTSARIAFLGAEYASTNQHFLSPAARGRGDRMNKYMRLLGLALALCLVGLPVTTSAQQPDKVPRLGWLGNLAATAPVYDGFRQGLRELGYVEGKNIIIEARWVEGKLDRLPEFARKLARLNVNGMLVSGDQLLRSAKEATSTTPMVGVGCDPFDSRVASIARPGGKASGLTCISSELASSTRCATPSCRRIGSRTSGADRSAIEASIMTPGGGGSK